MIKQNSSRLIIIISLITLFQQLLAAQIKLDSTYKTNNIKNKQRNLTELNSIHQDIRICDGNRFQFMSSFVLGRQNDLTKTFAQIQQKILLKNISYSDKIGRTYTIHNFVPKLVYLQSKQVAEVKGLNVLNISGGTVRITYDFKWEKVQIGSPVSGNASGLVSTDTTTFEKTLQTNQTHDLEWTFKSAKPISISNSLTVSKISPYKQQDAQIINLMLNNLQKVPTLKIQLIQSLNQNFTTILKSIVKTDQTIKIPKIIQYTYFDYRGEFDVQFDNVLLQNTLTKDGLSLLLSQAIRDDKTFQCGEKVKDQPEDMNKYGGTQEYISHKFFKSTLRYAIQHHNLDVSLSQQNWQSRAFQFYLGDLHDVMDSTKILSSFKSLNGSCQALDDKSFVFDKKTISTFGVTVNFTCSLLQNGTKIVDIILPVQYQIEPLLSSKNLDFTIKNIKGTPLFNQTVKYKITNLQLASFMMSETLLTAKKSVVIGSGYKTRSRNVPKFQVRDGYIFLYDKSTIASQSTMSSEAEEL